MADNKQHDISDHELNEIYQFAIQLGKDAGAILLGSLQKRRRDGSTGADQAGDSAPAPVELYTEEKLNAVDIVTETDNGMSFWSDSGLSQSLQFQETY
jgi:myo-inositol-1(or 4)-monophosphatase